MLRESRKTFADADAPMPETPAQAEVAVKDLKALGVDAIKIQRDDLSWVVKGSGTLCRWKCSRPLSRKRTHTA